MKLPDIYGDWKIVIGLVLISLGAGNWIIGLQRTQIYSHMIASRAHSASSTDYRSFDELDAGGGGAVLEPLTEQERQTSYATARMDFYHAGYLVGRVMVMIGVGLALLGFMGVIQRDSRRVYRWPTESSKRRPGLSRTPPA